MSENYEFLFIGDTHYDTDFDVYHHDYNEPVEWLNRVQREEFARNCQLWKGNSPEMIRAAGSFCNERTKFVLQAGDLIQGDCNNPEVHGKMLTDALAMFKKSFPGLPFLPVIGNHDIRGLGAAEIYRALMPKYLSGELGFEVKSVNFYFCAGGDLYLFVDFNDPDPQVIREAFEKHGDARYKFVMTHGSALPLDTWPYHWYLFGKQPELRHEMLKLFCRHHAIVLTGHTHTVEFMRYANEDGVVTQLVMNAVWMQKEQELLPVESEGAAAYGSLQMKRWNVSESKDLFDEYRPYLTDYWRAQGAGYARILVDDSGVKALVYGGSHRTPDKVFDLA